MTNKPEEAGTLKLGEIHPITHDVVSYLRSLSVVDLMIWQESFASNAIEGNRLGEVCGETLRRFLSGEPVSDRYLLGLAWTIKKGE